MAKPTTPQSTENLDFNIVSLDDFDPMAHLGKGPITPETDEDSDEEDDPEADAPVRKPAKTPKETKPLVVDDAAYDAAILRHFGKDPEEEDEDEDEEEGDDPERKPAKPAKKSTKPVLDESSAMVAHYRVMTEGGYWEEIEDFDGTPEAYQRALEHNRELDREQVYEEIIEEAFQNNPSGAQKGKALLKHLVGGGSVESFQQLYSGSDLKVEDLDDENEDRAKQTARDLLTDYYQRIGWAKDKISARLQKYDKLDSLVEEARELAPERDALIQKQQKESEATQAAQKRARQAADRALLDGLNQVLDQNPSFAGTPLYKDKKQRLALQQYLLEPDPDTKQSGLIRELNALLRDPQALPYLGKFVQDKMWQDGKLKSPQQVEKAVKGSFEKTIAAALQNQPITQRSAPTQTPASKSSKSKHKFDYDNFEVLS